MAIVTKKNDSMLATSGRRDFMLGLLAGGVGGAITSIPQFLNNSEQSVTTSSDDGASVASSNAVLKQNEKVPALREYPVKHVNDLFILFTNVAQTIAPKLRSLPEYQKSENDIFKEVSKLKFFVYGNDYVKRVQNYYGDTSILIPPDRAIAGKYLEQSIRDYPQGWSRIIMTLFTFSPEVTKAFLLNRI